ncbi:phage tail assembly chaperone [Maricaulis sp. CAU 1757]
MTGCGPDWGAALLAAVRMGLAPADFWRLSVAEWRLMCAVGTHAGRPLGRAGLEALMERFGETGDGGV